jgi:hypothetical protein
VVIEGVCLESFEESVVILPLTNFGELDVESYLFRGERLGLYILAGYSPLISTVGCTNRISVGINNRID